MGKILMDLYKLPNFGVQMSEAFNLILSFIVWKIFYGVFKVNAEQGFLI